jgi:hypothetical protein
MKALSVSPYVIQVKNREEILSELKIINISLIDPHTIIHPLHDHHHHHLALQPFVDFRLLSQVLLSLAVSSEFLTFSFL